MWSLFSAVSEMDISSSGLILSSWTWLFNVVRRSSLLTEMERNLIIQSMRARGRKYLSKHHLVSWVLDPRVQGHGLSSSGKRVAREAAKDICIQFLSSEPSTLNQLVKEWMQYDQKRGINIISFKLLLGLIFIHFRTVRGKRNLMESMPGELPIHVLGWCYQRSAGTRAVGKTSSFLLTACCSMWADVVRGSGNHHQTKEPPWFR